MVRKMQKKYNVLCIDDEENVLRALQRSFRKETFNVYTALSGKEGLKILENLSVHLIIADFRMPQMNGVEFFTKAKKIQPDAIRVLLSGYASIDMVTKAVNEGGIYRLLTKPWNEIELRQEINLALQHWELVQRNRKLNKKIEEQLLELKSMNRQLEDIVEERTREILIKNQALELSHQILDNLPTAVMGVALEKYIVYFNKEAEEIFQEFETNPIGKKVDDIFPEEISQIISDIIDKDRISELKKYEYLGKTFHIKASVVKDEFAVRGVTVVFFEV